MSAVSTQVCLLTRHQKALALLPALRRAGFAVEELSGFDADALDICTNPLARR